MVSTNRISLRHSEEPYIPLHLREGILWISAQKPHVLVEEHHKNVGFYTSVMKEKKVLLYGVPSFLVGRVLDEETGAPVENALVIILGKGSLALAKTGAGGWFTEEEDLQSPGTYMIAVLKLGYHMELQLTEYQDEPQELTVLLKKRW